MVTAMTLREDQHTVEIVSSTPPHWVHLIPSGQFSGRDGRGPYTLDVAAVLAAFADNKADLPVDFDHQSLTAAEKAGPVPAAGWIKELAVREDGVWGRVEWTPRAAETLANREYRYLSPVFRYEAKTGRVVALVSAGLTNTPNLILRAAARAEGAIVEELMNRIIAMLNLPVTATADDVVTELQKVIDKLRTTETEMQTAQARLAAGPDPAQWVPKSMYDEAAQRVSTLETERLEAAVNAAVADAQAQRKITPAMKHWALDYARRDLAGFKAYVAAAPAFISSPQAPPPAPALTPRLHEEGAEAAQRLIETVMSEHQARGQQLTYREAAIIAAGRRSSLPPVVAQRTIAPAAGGSASSFPSTTTTPVPNVPAED